MVHARRVANTPSVRSFRVLLVDQSERFLASARHWIESRTDLHLVGTARSGRAALKAAAELSPDLVIIEAVLPEIDGFRVTRLLKERANAPLVVVVTFHACAAARDEAFLAGADGFVAKENFSDGLEAILEAWRTERPCQAGGVLTPANIRTPWSLHPSKLLSPPPRSPGSR